jgi:ferredoxin
MSPVATPIDPDLNRRARDLALEAVEGFESEPTSMVGYTSQGRVLIIATDAAALEVAHRLETPLQVTVLLCGAHRIPAGLPFPVVTCGSDDLTLSGYLGAFQAVLAGGKAAEFDLVLDLSPEPLISYEVPPPGYYAPGEDPAALEQILADLPERVGEFGKPKFFAYDPGICAHGNSNIEACRRCLDACPAGAITSLGDRIAVESHLCQGGGACATVCPTGAITYRYPPARDGLKRLRLTLEAYHREGGRDAMVVIHDEEAGARRISALEADGGFPANAIPFMVEEVASVGSEMWLTALCYGARAVRLVDTPAIPERSRAAVDAELDWVRALLEGMGYPADAIAWLVAGGAHWNSVAKMPELASAAFAGLPEKRRTLFQAIDYLQQVAPDLSAETPLPAGAPMGQILVDAKGCTLCLSCAGVCPAKALGTGTETPKLVFFEVNCVQCGLCAKACPEQVITLQPRVLHDVEQRTRPRSLKEEEPFRCVSCGKPFGTRSGIEKVLAKLEGHWMFQDERARRRLQMCEDCRVFDMMRDSGKLG